MIFNIKKGKLPNIIHNFKHKSIPQLESNAKLTQKTSEITSSPLWPNKKIECTFTNITFGSPLGAL